MSSVLAHTGFMTARHVRNLARQPWYVAFTLVQPIIYLVLFGQLFRSVAQLPGFGGQSYIAYLTPGIVVMATLFSSGWSGMGTIEDLDRGVLDRFLVSPASRTSLIAGRLVLLAVVSLIQAGVIVLLGLLLGASYAGGLVGVLVLAVSAVLLSAPFAALSNAMALMLRQEESVIAAVNFVILPLTFISSLFMAQSLVPGWIRTVSAYNPVNWAVEAAREALGGSPDWGLVGSRLGFLVAFGIVAMWLAVRAFRAYQRSV